MNRKLFSPADIAPGMFSSPQIMECLQKDLLLRGWVESSLMPASYDMRLGDFACWYVSGLRTVRLLGPEADLNRGIHPDLVFEPNSLTFVSTIEEFRLPCDIIARFNLRTAWVRKGLLLGTAPIVDPEFEGRLLIPIHNFSSAPVQIEYGAKFIAVEFTKTLSVAGAYVNNPAPKGEISQWLESTGAVESSVSSALSKNQKLFNDIQTKTRTFSIAGAITLFLLICSALTLVINIFNVAENARKSAAQADSVVKAFSEKNAVELGKMREELRELEFELKKMREGQQSGRQ